MLFAFNLWNHNATGKRSIEDIIGIIAQQLRAMSHEAWWDPSKSGEQETTFVYGPNRINVIVEGFKPYHVERLAAAHAGGCRFIMLATEEPTPNGFNHGITPESGSNPHLRAMQQEMVNRQEIFPEAAKFCEGILHLVPGKHITEWYSQFAPSAYAELGYAPKLYRPRQFPVPTYDFGFYGSLTPRRQVVLYKLAKAIRRPYDQAVVVVSDFKTQEERDYLMRRAKVLLQIRKVEAMGLVSSSRCNTALMIGRPIVAESHDLSKPWDEVIDFPATPEEFHENALAARDSWRELHAEQLERFKKAFPPDYCIGEPLRTIGIKEIPMPRRVPVGTVDPVAQAAAARRKRMLKYGTALR